MPIASIATSPAIDLSDLPPPVLVDQPDFETRLAAKIARLITTAIAGGLDFSALVESDPAIKLLEADSYDEMVTVQRFNDACRQMLVAFATGANLEQIGAFYGVTRLVITPADEETGTLAVMEADSELRARVLLAPHSFSVAGPESAYVYHAMSASGDVLHASAISPTPGQVVVSVLSRTGDGTAPPETLEAVEAVLTDDAVRPLTDEVIVQSAEIIPYDVEAELWLYAGPDPALILETATAALNEMLQRRRKLGRDMAGSAIVAALHVAGVQRVDLVEPLGHIVIGPTQSGWPASVNVTIAGYDE